MKFGAGGGRGRETGSHLHLATPAVASTGMGLDSVNVGCCRS